MSIAANVNILLVFMPAINRFFQKEQDTETHVRSMVCGENTKGT